MTQPFDDAAEWTAIAAAWQRHDAHLAVDPRTLEAKIRRDTTMMQRVLVVEIAFSLAVVAFTVWTLISESSPRGVLIAVDTCVVLAIVWAFALWGRRGLWQPSAESTREYLVVSRRRAELRLRAAWLALVLVVAQLLVARAASVPSSLVQWLASIGWLVWAVWLRRRATRECRRLDALLAQYVAEQ
jgi:hypothetical protein